MRSETRVNVLDGLLVLSIVVAILCVLSGTVLFLRKCAGDARMPAILERQAAALERIAGTAGSPRTEAVRSPADLCR